MSSRADRRLPSLRRTGAPRRARTFLAAVLGLVVVGAGAAPLALTTAARAADRPDVAALTVASFEPAVAQPGGTLKVTGTVRSGAEQLADGIVRLRVGTSPLTLRKQLADVAEGTTTPTTILATSETESVDQDAGASRAFSLSVSLDSLGLGVAGAYPVVVDLQSAVTGANVASTTTFLSWFPEGTAAQPTRVVWTVPLIGTPARDADGVFVDDRTAAAIASGGRLRTLLDAVGGTSAGWAVDPELLEAVRDMSDGYEVRNEEGEVVPGGASGTAAAQSFLTAVRSKLARGDVSALGYADPDANALQRAGLTADLTLATTKGPPIAAAVLGRPVRGDLAWPAGDAAYRATLSTLKAAGTSSVLLADTALPVDQTLTFTPTGLARVQVSGGSLTAVLSDTTLDAIVASPDTQGGDAVARARYLAETLVITQQRPSDPRTVVVAPPRTWDVSGALARELVTLGGRVPWLESASLGELLEQDPPDVARGALEYPDAARKAELTKAQVDGARALGQGIDTFTGILADPAATATRYTAAQLRTVSSAFRGQRARGTELLDAVDGNLERDRDKVRVLSRGTVRLSGATGQVPITVANDLDQSVVVQVRLTPSSPVKLRVDPPSEVRLGPRKKETIEVGARAATSGTVPVEVALVTTSGALYSEPTTLQVRSTAYSRVGLVIIGVALAALLILIVARLVRRVRRDRRAGE